MDILSQLPETMQHILTTVADEAACESGFAKRNRKLTGSAFTQTLCFGWFTNPEASYGQLSQTANALGISVSRQGIAQRFTPEAAEMLKSTLSAAAASVVAPPPQALPLLAGFKGVYLMDSTTLQLPDELHEHYKGPRRKNKAQTAALKLHLRIDITTGQFDVFELTDAITADSTLEKACPELPPGSLRIVDLAYFSLETFDKLTKAGVYWITPLKVSCHLFDEAEKPFCLKTYLDENAHKTAMRIPVRVGKTKKLHAVLIAQRIRPEAEVKRRRHLKKRAKRKNLRPSKIRLQLAGWNLYLTNIEEHKGTPAQIATLYSTRWQVELLFKCFKSIGKCNVSRSQKPYRRLCEVYAKLLIALIRHWIMLATGWRCIQHSIIETAKYIGTYAIALLIAFRTSKNALRKTLETIKGGDPNSDGAGIKPSGKNTTLTNLLTAKNTLN